MRRRMPFAGEALDRHPASFEYYLSIGPKYQSLIRGYIVYWDMQTAAWTIHEKATRVWRPARKFRLPMATQLDVERDALVADADASSAVAANPPGHRSDDRWPGSFDEALYAWFVEMQDEPWPALDS